MSAIEWTDAEASDLEDLAINLGHIDDDPEVILRRTREIHETVAALVAAREARAAAKELREAADVACHECHLDLMARADGIEA